MIYFLVINVYNPLKLVKMVLYKVIQIVLLYVHRLRLTTPAENKSNNPLDKLDKVCYTSFKVRQGNNASHAVVLNRMYKTLTNWTR
jgi:hypothetical protein